MPIKAWLENDKFYQEVRAIFSQNFAAKFFDQDKIIALLDATHEKRVDGRRKVWTIYTFLIWYKVYFVDDTIPQYVPADTTNEVNA